MSRKRQYMDRLLGRNEGNETRDFTSGRSYGESQNFYDEPFRRSSHDHEHRTQASRNRPNPSHRSDYERDYSVRNSDTNYERSYPHGSSRNFDYDLREGDERYFSERNQNLTSRFDRNDSYETENRGFYGKGPKNWRWSDERIKDQVSEALYRDYHVDASDIEVEVKEGVVTLSGSVDSREAKRAAEECIENLSGVIDVHNRIHISSQGNVSNMRSNTDSKEGRALS